MSPGSAASIARSPAALPALAASPAIGSAVPASGAGASVRSRASGRRLSNALTAAFPALRCNDSTRATEGAAGSAAGAATTGGAGTSMDWPQEGQR